MSSLCIACCSTITKSGPDSYKTSCCNKQICEPCLASNPRLRYYSPCLACCGAADVVKRSKLNEYNSPLTEQRKREENTFVIGEDDDDQDNEAAQVSDTNTPMDSSDAISASQASEDVSRPEEPTETSGPAKYWLKKGDTLHGVALRFKVDGREICRLNGLPPSTLSTTPHLLHTRSFILLPPTDRKPPSPPPEAEAREEQRKKERAAKQFQFVTKEVDWRIAKAYVALADIDDIDDEYGMKRKEAGRARPQSGTAGTAVERYMDDDEWERDQLQAGLSPRIPQFPFFASKA